MKAAKHKNGSVDSNGVGTRISCASYRSCDEFIDVQRLRSLDGYLARRIERYVNTKVDDPRLNSACEISLTKTSIHPERAHWQWTEEALEFTMLMEFIETLPYKSTGRVVITYYDHSCLSPLQTDPQQVGDFIWFQTNLRKRFYLKSEQTGKKVYIDSYSALFDTANQQLGADVSDSLAFSIRVEGQFTDKFRREIAVPRTDLARKPALLEESCR